MSQETEIAEAIENMVDVIADHNQKFVSSVEDLACKTKQIADSITIPAAPGRDASGGSVSCLTEAVMGLTSGLFKIACAIEILAESVDGRSQ